MQYRMRLLRINMISRSLNWSIKKAKVNKCTARDNRRSIYLLYKPSSDPDLKECFYEYIFQIFSLESTVIIKFIKLLRKRKYIFNYQESLKKFRRVE